MNYIRFIWYYAPRTIPASKMEVSPIYHRETEQLKYWYNNGLCTYQEYTINLSKLYYQYYWYLYGIWG